MRGESDRASIIRTYGNFKGLEIEKQKLMDKGLIKCKMNAVGKTHSMAIYGFDAMFHSMRESNRLREEYAARNDIKYDLILFVRPDIRLKNPLDINKVLEVFPKAVAERGFFTLSHTVLPAISGLEAFGGTDLLFFGKPEVISDIVKNTAQCVGRFKQNATLGYCPEYELTKLVAERGWTPFYLADYRQERDWDIQRHLRVRLRKRIIRLHIRKNMFLLWLFPKMARRIINLQLNLFGIYTFDIAVGNPGHEENK
jgi:hypothetical protein